MTRLQFELAEAGDDRELRALAHASPMPGQVSLAFTREPCFFLADKAGNLETQTMVCRDKDTGGIVGLAARSHRRVYVDGEERCSGYLSMLRSRREARSGTGLARGYRFLHSLHADRKAPYYLTSILEDNAAALSQLTGGRGGLPVYSQVARFITYLIPLRRNPRKPRESALVRRAILADLPEAVAALNLWDRKHQFAPYYRLDDLLGKTGLLPAFDWQDLYLQREHGKVVGTLGVWDQSTFKQTKVASYSRQMNWMRPFYNLLATIRGIPGLPDVGGQIKCLYAALLSVEDNSRQILTQLIEQICYDRSGQGYDYLVLGAVEGHALQPVIARYACRQIASRIYLVYWHDDPVPDFNRQIPMHLETATL